MVWIKAVHSPLGNLRFIKSESDSGPFTMKDSVKIRVVALILVDDVLLVGLSEKAFKYTAYKKSLKIETRKEKKNDNFLSMIIDRNETTGSINFHNSPMIQGILKRFNMEKCRAAPAPLPGGKILVKAEQAEM